MSSPVVLLGHTHSHVCAKQHLTLTHITRRSQDVGPFKSVEAQGLDSRPLLSPEGLGTIRFLYADASLTDTGANLPPVTHICASTHPTWLCQGEDSSEGQGCARGSAAFPGLQRLQGHQPRALGQPLFHRRGGWLPGSLATKGLRQGSCLSGRRPPSHSLPVSRNMRPVRRKPTATDTHCETLKFTALGTQVSFPSIPLPLPLSDSTSAKEETQGRWTNHACDEINWKQYCYRYTSML